MKCKGMCRSQTTDFHHLLSTLAVDNPQPEVCAEIFRPDKINLVTMHEPWLGNTAAQQSHAV